MTFNIGRRGGNGSNIKAIRPMWLRFYPGHNDKPHLIDFHPRATQTSHLVSHDGRQPVAWRSEHLRGCKPAAVMRPNLDPIVLFFSRLFLER